MIKVILILIVVSLDGVPKSIEVQQPSIEACAQQVEIHLTEARGLVGATKYMAAMCVVAPTPGKPA